jgi:hypothetical protein
MWMYSQTSGKLQHNGVPVTIGYSGHAEGKNNPEMQDHIALGPIPRGEYTIGPTITEVYERKAPPVFHLIPNSENEMFGRDGFLIHGDSIHAAGTASLGCIIVGKPFRDQIADSDDRILQVTV